MGKTVSQQIRTDSISPPSALTEGVAPGEWPILRACWRLGPKATTAQVVREVQTEALVDFAHTQTLLRRLASKGLVTKDQDSPRRLLWTATISAEDAVRHEIYQFLSQVVGQDQDHLQLIRQVLEEFESQSAAQAQPDALPHAIRVRLIDFFDDFLVLRQHRLPLAEAFGLPKSITTSSTLSKAIALLNAAGGDTPNAALALIEAAEDILEDHEKVAAEELAAIRRALASSAA